MNIAIAGSGAMGCRFGSMLDESGNSVLLVDNWKEHIETINNRGLTIINESGTHNQKITACIPEEAGDKVDLLIVFTKAMHTESMVNRCQKLIGENTRVVTLQNGLGNIETLEKYVPRNRIIAGVTTFGTELLGPGEIQALGSGRVQIMQADREETKEIQEVAYIMNEAGMNVEISANVSVSIWNKVAFNCVLNTLCTLMRDTVSAVGSYSEINDVINEIIDEIILVAGEEEIYLNKDSIMNMITAVFDLKMSGNHLPSMHQDMVNRRKTEIDFLNGAIVKKADLYQISVPVNRFIVHLIKMMEEIRGN
ncbi:ketopantoate reductase family protein [Lentibacillus salinarum]|uniref:2-dehydropantoate 2-reductase n=1 Tax=Lentibacillus salinarum TaxID=446820 RepID=A0ABW3ZS45_9BACI